jgi:hypothetical protein
MRNKAILTFTHAAGLKSLNGKPLIWFSIAGDDRKFVEAKAEIVGDTFVVTSEAVANPAAVRFGESDEWAKLGKIPRAERLRRNMIPHAAADIGQPLAERPGDFEQQLKTLVD